MPVPLKCRSTGTYRERGVDLLLIPFWDSVTGMGAQRAPIPRCLPGLVQKIALQLGYQRLFPVFVLGFTIQRRPGDGIGVVADKLHCQCQNDFECLLRRVARIEERL